MRENYREDLYLNLLSDYVLVNEIVNGQLNISYLDKLGIKYGLKIEDSFREKNNLQEKLNSEQFNKLLLDFFTSLGSEYRITESNDERTVLTCYSCIFNHMVVKSPHLCRIMKGVFGGIAARNFPYNKVSVESSIAKKSSICQIVYYLQETEQANSAKGSIYISDPASYLLSRQEIDIASDKLLATNDIYNKYIDNYNSLKSLHYDLKSEYNQLRDEIFSDLELGILTLNEHGKIIYMNKTAQELLRFQEDNTAVVNHSLQELLQETLSSGISYKQEEILITLADRVKYYSASTNPFFGEEGKIIGVISVFQDITRKKHLEKEIQQMEKFSLVAELAAGTAHEIRNPLTTIRGFLQFLVKEFNANSKGFEYCNVMIEEIDRVNAIIKEFLLLTKPSAPVLKETDLHLILEDIFLLIESKSLLENVNLEKNYNEGVPRVKVDSSHIKQVFLNLATNAIQAMPDGGKLMISTFSKNNCAYVIFSDTGCGIEEVYQRKIFDPFFTTKQQGTGLGLAISYRIVETHGGRLSVESLPGKGSAFTIELPAIKVDA